MLATYQLNLETLIEQLNTEEIVLCGNPVSKTVVYGDDYPRTEYFFGESYWFSSLQTETKTHYQFVDSMGDVVLHHNSQFMVIPDGLKPIVINKYGFELEVHQNVLDLLIQHATPVTELEFKN